MRDTTSPVAIAGACAALMIAAQVAGKATRDALFLTLFPVSALPVMIVTSSLACILVAVIAARWVARIGPARMLLVAFSASAVLFLGERWLYAAAPRAIATTLYMHLAILGIFTVSAFWSLLNERFDPRSARRAFGRIAAASTVGGIAGGLLVASFSTRAGVTGMLIPLAALNVACLVLALRVARIPGLPEHRAGDGGTSGAVPDLGRELRRLFADRYLRDLGLFVLLGTIGTTLADYVFKAEAARTIPAASRLLRFFALYYTASGLLTWLAHVSLTRRVLARVGVPRTTAVLPAVVGTTGAAFVFFPGLPTAALFRGSENVFRNSLFRAGYELLYTPLPRRERRVAKPIVDIGAERVGDVLGGVLVKAILIVTPAALASRSLAMAAVAVALAGIYLTQRLQTGYVRTLERNLVGRGAEQPFISGGDESMATITIPRDLFAVVEPHPPPESLPAEAARLADLLSDDEGRIQRGLVDPRPLPAACVSAAISLLAREGATRMAIRALRRVVPRMTGQLVDALLEPEIDVEVRRRIPHILAAAPDSRAVEGLMLALEDWRFDVRYHSARALARITETSPALVPDTRRVHAAVLREVAAGRAAWESSGPLTPAAAADSDAAGADERLLRERAGRSMEHVFCLLSLVYPREPLRVALGGLYSRDRGLRGTALEYLESLLPADIRDAVWPYLEAGPSARRVPRTPEEIMRDLAQANPSIEISLRELRESKEP